MKNSSVGPEYMCVCVCRCTHTHISGNQRKARVQFPHPIFLYQREAIKGLLYKLY